MVNLVTPKQHLLQPVLFGRAYWKKVLNIDASNLIGYWPMNEMPASQEYLTFNGSSTIVVSLFAIPVR